MNASAWWYDADNKPLKHRDVTPDEFRAAAVAAEWQPRSIDLFLLKPISETPVQVGYEVLTVK